MQIDRVLYPIESLGPGRRLVIWTVGCSKHCENCSNQELWFENAAKDIDTTQLFGILKNAVNDQMVEGITITGGDPLEQPGELIRLLRLIITISNDILVYTGYTIEELQENLSVEIMSSIKEYVSVLIEGRYIDVLNDNSSPLRGSVNQKIIFFDESMRERYETYMSNGRRIQNVFYKERVVSVGIHNKEKREQNA